MKNVKVNDTNYSTVSIVELPLADGTGNAQFKEVSEIIEPSGTKNITSNGEHDVAAYASVTVNVAGGDDSGDVKDQLIQYCNGEIASVDLTGATAIPMNLFRDNTTLTGVTMPDVTVIYGWGFYGCTNLLMSELPSGLTTINNNSFQNSNVSFSTFPSGVTMLGNGAFQNCKNVTFSSVPDGVTSVANYIFSGCSSITEFTFHSNVTNVGNNSLGDCSALTKVTFKGTPVSTPGMAEIHANAFANCTNLKDIYVPWAEGTIPNAPWGATNATIHYNSAV